MKKLFESKQKIPVIKKDAKNPFFKSGYATLSNIIEVVEPILAINGLFLINFMAGDTLKTQIWDSESSVMVAESSFALPTNGDIQKIGSAITYAKRYNITALLNLNIEDDDDGNATKKTEPKSEPKKAETITPECKTAMALIESCKDLGSLKTAYEGIKDSTKLTESDKSFLNNLIKEKKAKLE